VEILFIADERINDSRPAKRGAELQGGTTRLPQKARWPAGFHPQIPVIL